MFPDSFSTIRLLLRPIAPDDAGPIFRAYTADAAVTRFLTWQAHQHPDQTAAYVARCLATPADVARAYVLVGQDDRGVRGAFDARRTGPHRVGYGYVLARAWWGHGLMTEALAAVADWALRLPAIWRIGDVCDTENHASARVMEKAGLAREGMLRRWAVHPNLGDEPRDCFSYARVR
jgi:[ribosomal protein S5]-alanine N-acetyltransferase